jgi:hypothetical protein
MLRWNLGIHKHIILKYPVTRNGIAHVYLNFEIILAESFPKITHMWNETLNSSHRYMGAEKKRIPIPAKICQSRIILPRTEGNLPTTLSQIHPAKTGAIFNK